MTDKGFLFMPSYQITMKIRWHGHSCFEISDSETKIIIDPHDGKSIGIKPPTLSANIVLISHDHFDHNATRMIRGEYSCIFADPGKKKIGNIVIEGFPSYHDEEMGVLRGLNVIYKFKMDGITVCHCGDLGDIPSEEVIDALRGVDIIFVPTGETITLSISKLEAFLDIIDPKIIVPMHYKVGSLTLPLKTLDDFLERVSEEMILYVGNEIELFSDDISEFLGLWVFDR